MHGISTPREFTVLFQPQLPSPPAVRRGWSAGGSVGKQDRWLGVNAVPLHSNIVLHEHLVPARYHSDLWGGGVPPLGWKALGRGSGEELGRPEGWGDRYSHSNEPIV